MRRPIAGHLSYPLSQQRCDPQRQAGTNGKAEQANRLARRAITDLLRQLLQIGRAVELARQIALHHQQLDAVRQAA